MDAFNPTPPTWTKTATHAVEFCCPHCRNSPAQAQQVWINRYAPVINEDYRRKWQEFYKCQCGKVWWGWSSDRPPSELNKRDLPPL
jgi:hypothetical protein